MVFSQSLCLSLSTCYVLHEPMGQLVPLASCLSKVLTSTSSSLSSLEPQHFLVRAVGGTFSKKHLMDIFLVSWDYEARIC